MVTRRTALLAALLAVGCDAGFEVRSIVVDLRVLGAAAEPPEVVVDIDLTNPTLPAIPAVALTLLVADPGATRRLEWEILACPETMSLRCDDPEAPVESVGAGVIDDPEEAGAAPATATFLPSPALLGYVLENDIYHGLGGIVVLLSIRVSAEDGSAAAWAARRQVYAARYPAERRANQNPSIAGLVVDQDDFPGGPCGGAAPARAVRRGERLRFLPLEAAAIHEDYVLPAYDGSARWFTESISYSWFATAGSFSAEVSGGPLDPFGNWPPLATDWVAPDVAGPVELWVVQRDERNGMSWARRCLDVL